jgi:hypothetical protein
LNSKIGGKSGVGIGGDEDLASAGFESLADVNAADREAVESIAGVGQIHVLESRAESGEGTGGKLVEPTAFTEERVLRGEGDGGRMG